jgi:large repetitive protein
MKSATKDAISRPIGTRPAPVPSPVPVPSIQPAAGTDPPTISGTSAGNMAIAGTMIDIFGSNLTDVSAVTFGPFGSTSYNPQPPNRIANVLVPDPGSTGAFFAPIVVTIVLANGNPAMNIVPFDFTILPRFAFSTFAPMSGPPGTDVTLVGVGLNGLQSVRFNGTPGTIKSRSDTSAVVTVPDGATTGLILISNGMTSLQSTMPFTVLPSPPVITDIQPRKAPVGATVKIIGKHLKTVSQVVFTKRKQATIQLPEFPQELTVTVPAGAETGPVRVVSPNGDAVSPKRFVVLPS